MNILLIEDRTPDGRIVERLASKFGVVRWARNMGEVRDLARNGFRPDFVITDLHLPDGPDSDFGVMAEVLEMFGAHAGIAALTSDVSEAKRDAFAQSFRSFRIFDKGAPKDLEALRELLVAQRFDESGKAQTTIDQGSGSSRTWFRSEAVLLMRDLGVPEPVLFWVQSRIESTKRRLSFREKAFMGVTLALLIGAIATIAPFVLNSSWVALVRGALP